MASGDRVAIVSESRPEWLLSDMAVLALGAVTVPIYPTLTARRPATSCRRRRPPRGGVDPRRSSRRSRRSATCCRRSKR